MNSNVVTSVRSLLTLLIFFSKWQISLAPENIYMEWVSGFSSQLRAVVKFQGMETKQR